MDETKRHQMVLDEAWKYLQRECDWFSREHAASIVDERFAQLWKWNGRRGSPLRE